MKKVLITPRSYGLFDEGQILKRFDSDKFEIIREKGPFRENELVKKIQGVHAAIIGTDQVTKKVLEAADQLELIVKYGVGLDNIDLEYTKEKGILVENTAGVNTEAVADYTFGLMLTLARQIHISDREIRQGEWKKRVGSEIYNKTIGILGLGAIGKSIARRAFGFDMKILAYDLCQDTTFANQFEVTYCGIEEIIEQSDIICIHLPLNNETKHLINKEQLAKMKPNTFIINTARGGIIDEKALYEALQNKIIAGAAVDVFEEEPPKNSPLTELENVILTPHNASASEEATLRMTIQTTDKVLAFYQERSELIGNLH
ncbi:phosphoglycerate dehydrogenase [Lederbergia citrea]|uniref:Phosphoglycerate dehydrogenase n=1 Tax=Lederbergia citrea TaxID=2833581 RepID=A0A942UN36_9BACI|nr:phosphoglycerate dehydrogenase [Lederbergia citrea]MBS4221733.1 phosphoglycerate dehydrogenase [Lederbergia citrea]